MTDLWDECSDCLEHKLIVWWYDTGAAICYDCHEQELLERDGLREFVRWLAAMDGLGSVEPRRSVTLQQIIDKAKALPGAVAS